MARSQDWKSSAVRITRPSRRLVAICCWTAWISARISARRSRGRSEASSGFRLWLGLRFGMVVPLVTGGSGNDDYQRACGRRETALHGTDSYGLLPEGLEPHEIGVGEHGLQLNFRIGDHGCGLCIAFE